MDSLPTAIIFIFESKSLTFEPFKLIMETIAIIGFIIAVLTFYFTFLSKPNAEINALRAKFRATQRMNLTLRKNSKTIYP